MRCCVTECLTTQASCISLETTDDLKLDLLDKSLDNSAFFIPFPDEMVKSPKSPVKDVEVANAPMNSKFIKIDNLTGGNFTSWRSQIEASLRISKLWIELKQLKAAPDADREKATQAFDHILLNCDSTVSSMLEQKIPDRDSIKAIRFLKHKYDGKDVLKKLEILKCINEMKLTDDDIESHVTRLECEFIRLSVKGLEIPDLVQVSTLMNSLPIRFSSVLSALIQLREDEFTFSRVSQAVIMHAKHEKLSAALEASTITAAVAKSTSGKRRERQKFAQKKKCTHCGRMGHEIDTCFYKNPSIKKQSNKKPSFTSSSNYTSEEPTSTEQANAVSDHVAFASRVVTFGRPINPKGIILPKFKPSAPTERHPNTDSMRITFRNTTRPGDKSAGKAKPYKRSTVQSKNGKPQIIRENRQYNPHMTISGKIFKPSLPRNSHRRSGEQKFVKETKPVCTDKMQHRIKSAVTIVNKGIEVSSPGMGTSLVMDYSSDSPSPATPKSTMNEDDDILELYTDLQLNKSIETYESAFFTQKSNLPNETWIIDSGASIHMTGNLRFFISFDPKHNGYVKVANGKNIPIKGKGSVKFFIKTANEPFAILIKGVAYVPDLKVNLISVSELTKSHGPILFDKDTCLLKVDDSFMKIGKFIDTSYELTIVEKGEQALLCAHEMHLKMAHRNLRDIRRLKNNGFTITRCNCSDECEACIKGKFTKLPFTHSEKPENPLDVIVSDLCGPFKTQSINGSKYFMTFVDVCTDFTTVYFLKHKNEATSLIKTYIEFTKTQLARKPKIFRSDGGGEYINKELEEYLNSEGIIFQRTVPYTPEQNGIAERKNRTLNDSVRTLLIASELPDALWVEAMNNVVYTHNRIIRKEKELSPIELFFGKTVAKIFMEFGQPVYVATQMISRGKLSPHAKVARFLSVDNRAKGFRLWDGTKVIVERNIRPRTNTQVSYEENFSECPIADDCENNKPVEGPKESLRRSERIKAQNVCNSAEPSVDSFITEPKTYNQALKGADKDEWIAAMQQELNSISNQNTFELCKLPPGRNAIGCKWVFKLKNEPGGIRRKARLVAQGFSQKFGEDYDEVFAPVARSTTIRLLLSMAGKLNLHLKQFDVTTAFLNGTLSDEIYMKPPPGFETNGDVMRLRKGLYGLKQSANIWNKMLVESLTKESFVQSEADECLFIRRTSSDVCYIVVHVDDMLCAASNERLIAKIIEGLAKYFELKDLGEVRQFLGIDIHKSKGLYCINQEKYIHSIAQEFQMEDAKPEKFPIHPGYYNTQCDEFLDSNSEYRKIIGKLLYISINTRPDVSAAVCILAKRVSKPRKLDMHEATRVVKYLNTTRKHLLCLNSDSISSNLQAYCDANFAECKLDAKSNSGFICYVNGGTISWACRKQSLVAQSTCEAEYSAIAECVREVAWLRQLLSSFNIQMLEPTTVFNDNMSTLKKLDGNSYLPRTKYFAVRYHGIKDLISKNLITLEYCDTENNVADLLTKPLNHIKLTKHRITANVLNTSE